MFVVVCWNNVYHKVFFCEKVRTGKLYPVICGTLDFRNILYGTQANTS